MPAGYYRYPTIFGDTIVFVSEDDLWTTEMNPARPGNTVARRLTSNLGEVSWPRFSPDGEQLAFVGREEGQAEVYLMPAAGGPAHRLTFMGGGLCLVLGWTAQGKVIFANNADHWYLRFTHLFTQDPAGGPPERLELGLARSIAFGPQGGVVLGRYTDDPARWKRYRGGTAGCLWIDPQGSGEFQPFLPNLGNLTSPMWLAETDGAPGPAHEETGRIYFISDHEGAGNLYSCLPSGEDLKRHTRHEGFYARNASTDGRRIVYHAGADLYLFDPASGQSTLAPVDYRSPRVQRNRKFTNPARYLEDWELHPGGQGLAITARGKLFTFANWEGAVIGGLPQHEPLESPAENGPATGVRCRLPAWLADGKRLAAVTDAGGEEAFVIFNVADPTAAPEILPVMDTGRPVAVAANPRKDLLAFSNNRYELLCLDLETRQLQRIDRGHASRINRFSWSPDGEWLAYSVSISSEITVLKLWNAASGEITQLTAPVLRDLAPTFDPRGRYLYFISYRTFNPVYDALHFELSFPRGAKPYLITLRKDEGSPFVPRPRLGEEPKDKKGLTAWVFAADDQPGEEIAPAEEPDQAQESASPEEAKEKEPEEPQKITIDLDGIQDRVIAFPIQEGLYGAIFGATDGKVLYSRLPLEGALGRPAVQGEPDANGVLMCYNFEDRKEEALIPSITSFKVTPNGQTLIYRAGNDLRVLKAGEKPASDNHNPNRKSGWIDLERIKMLVEPGAEWRQMYREAWRLQRDQFWAEDMSQVEWLAVHDRYLPLVDRIGSRSEFSDLMWEMQGELGTSHAYEFGGDYRPEPKYSQGYLGADFTFDEAAQAWRIAHIYQGDVWDPGADSPLHQPGINVQEGDLLVAINGRPLTRQNSPQAALVNHAGEEILLTVQPAASQAPEPGDPQENRRIVIVRTLDSEMQLRYREWVETNRRRVHSASGGRLGYLHIPDMQAWGYAEFHRGFLAETTRQGLVIDVRFNRGGHVSSLLLEKLARQRIGYDVDRWSQEPFPYPPYSFTGPLVALANEYSASDGDIFSHGFKLLKLGVLIGKRTWGGVIGIWPRHSLVDGTVTTQPEFSSWFQDVGWGVENYGTEPDIEVDISPQDYARGLDTQLERAIAEALRLLEANPPQLPDFSQKPSRAAPRLPTDP